MIKKLTKNRLIILTVSIVILAVIGILFINNSEQKISSTIYDMNINNTEINLITKNIVDIKPIEKVDVENLNENNEESSEIDKAKKGKIVIVNTPLIIENDTKESNKSVETKKEEKIIRYDKNEDIITKMKTIIFVILLRQGHFNDVSIEVDQEIFKEDKEYISIDDINETMFVNLTSNNKIKIYAVDEYIKNEFIRTRCYVEIK